jgi:predicted Zn finger-like uncharacterized protein
LQGSEPAKEKPVMIVTCPQCQKKYRVDQGQFHEGIKYLRCQACGRTFQLVPTPPETPSPESGLLELKCPGCKKVYKIDKNLVTPEMSTIPCKTCGLLVPIEVDLSSEPDEKPIDDQKDDVQPEVLSWTASSGRRSGIPQKRKKTIIFCAVAGIFLLIITGAYLGFKLFYEKEAVPLQSSQMPSKDLEVLSGNGPQPLIYMDVDLGLLRRVIANQISAEQKDLGYRIATAIFDSLSPERGHLFLYPDPEYQFLPVLLVQSNENADPKDSLIKKGILNQFLEPSTKGTYRIKGEAVASVAASGFPVDIYRVWFFKKSAVLGPKTLGPIWAMGEKALLSSGLVRFADFARKSGNLAVMSLRTADIRDGWEKSITEPLVQDADPQVAVIARMVGNALPKLTKPFKEINFLAIGFKFSGEKKRILSYVQEFRDGVKGAQIYKHLKEGAREDPDPEGLVLNLVQLLNDERLGRNISFEKNRLAIDLIWSEEDDESVFQSLADATMGYMLTQSPSSREPTAGPIDPRYVPAPQLVLPVNVSKIKGTIPEAVKNSLFPSHYWRLGDKPRMNLELDPIALPNAAIAELSYEILSIGVPGGKNVLRKEDSPLNQASGSFITLPVLKGTRGEDLGIANIRLNMTLPVKLHIFKFGSDAEKGTVKKADGLSVKLDRLERDVASVAFHGGKGCHLYALDKTGRTLASLESLGSTSLIFSRFQGIIDTLEVVVVSEVLEHSFDIKVDLNNGKELELPEKPDRSVPVRHDRHAWLTYADFARQDLNGLAVKWSKEKTLSLALPKSPFYGDAIWEAHFFDENKPALLAWDPMEMGGKFVVYFRKPLTKIPDAAFGRVRLELSTGIQRVTFSKKSGNGQSSKRLPSGQKVVVTFDKNQITYRAGKSRILQIAAYDSTGKQLRIGKYTSTGASPQRLF